MVNATCASYDAKLELRGLGVHARMVTRNTPEPNQKLGIELVQGPFTELKGTWTFKDYGEGCRVTLNLTCEFESSLLSVFSNALLKRGIEKTVEAFVNEARRRYDQG